MTSVLICEDEALVALDLEQMVYDAGFTPLGPARNLGEALEIADAARPSIAIVDLNLADGMTGAKVATVLAKRGTRIVILSSLTDVLASLAGISHIFVAKPVDPEVMTEILTSQAPGFVPGTIPADAQAESRCLI
jgi:DNA-binding NarL/FixJ family response regulator